MKKTKGMTKRLTALFLAVTFLAGTLSAGMNVEAAGKLREETYYYFGCDEYGEFTTKEKDEYVNYFLTDISEPDEDVDGGEAVYLCGTRSTFGCYAEGPGYKDMHGALIPSIHFYPGVNRPKWVKMDEKKFGGYRFRLVKDKISDAGFYHRVYQPWTEEERVDFDFTLKVFIPDSVTGDEDKVVYTFTKNDFDENGYCKTVMNLPMVKGMSYNYDTVYSETWSTMYRYDYESEIKGNVSLSLLPADEVAFVEYMSTRPDYDTNKYIRDNFWRLESAMIQKRIKTVRFPIVYDLDGGTNHGSNPKFYTPEQKVVLKDPSKKGYVFKGWEVTSNNGRDYTYSTSILTSEHTLKDNTIRKNSYGRACLKAVWEKEPDYYNVSYKLNGGKNNSSNEKTYSSKKGLKLKSPSKRGYSFKGWYYDSALKNRVKNNTIPKGTTGNIRVYAKWQKKTYTIKYVNAGKHKNPKKYTVTSKTIKLKSAKKAGYTFKGWYSDKKYTKKVTKIKKGSTGNRILYAKWQKIKK